jgi:hypothetical protein
MQGKSLDEVGVGAHQAVELRAIGEGREGTAQFGGSANRTGAGRSPVAVLYLIASFGLARRTKMPSLL